MGMKVFWTNFSKRKLKDIFSYYKKKVNPEFAKQLITDILERSSKLIYQPNQGQLEELLKHRPEDFRYILFKHFKIIYWINSHKNRIEIVHVFDSRQEPDKIGVF